MGRLGIAFGIITLIVMLFGYKDITAHNKAATAAKQAGRKAPKMNSRARALQIAVMAGCLAMALCFFMAGLQELN